VKVLLRDYTTKTAVTDKGMLDA